jgi:hypothetical protein
MNPAPAIDLQEFLGGNHDRNIPQHPFYSANFAV